MKLLAKAADLYAPTTYDSRYSPFDEKMRSKNEERYADGDYRILSDANQMIEDKMRNFGVVKGKGAGMRKSDLAGMPMANDRNLEQAVTDFIAQHPDLRDSDFHRFAESIGVKPDVAETMAYRILHRKLSSAADTAGLMKAVLVIRKVATQAIPVGAAGKGNDARGREKTGEENLPKGEMKFDKIPSPNIIGVGGPGRVESTDPLNTGGPVMATPQIGTNIVDALLHAANLARDRVEDMKGESGPKGRHGDKK